ncbi:MAG TPA: glycosyltransferase family 87 protein [Acidobacteriaceae bacterium]
MMKTVAAVCILAAGLAVIVLMTSQNSLAGRDWITYWASGRQLLSHQNPYDQAALAALDRSAGAGNGKVAIIRYPPSGLLFELLLAQFGPRTAGVLWILALIGALVISIRLLRQMMDQTGDRNHLLGYLFPPVLCCLMAGQIGILLLLSFTLFLYLHERHPWIAGAVLSFCLSKPHLMALPLTVLVVWSLGRKRFQILAGGALTLLACGLIPLYFDPQIWSHYLAGFRGEHIENEFIPVLSCVFRVLVHREWQMLQFVPVLCGIAWALAYYWRRRDSWEWLRDGSFLMAVGVLVAPYAWITDEALALPAVLFGLYALPRTGRSVIPYAVLALAGLGETLFAIPPGTGLYLWTAPAWVAWCVYAEWPVRVRERAPAAAS